MKTPTDLQEVDIGLSGHGRCCEQRRQVVSPLSDVSERGDCVPEAFVVRRGVGGRQIDRQISKVVSAVDGNHSGFEQVDDTVTYIEARNGRTLSRLEHTNLSGNFLATN